VKRGHENDHIDSEFHSRVFTQKLPRFHHSNCEILCEIEDFSLRFEMKKTAKFMGFIKPSEAATQHLRGSISKTPPNLHQMSDSIY